MALPLLLAQRLTALKTESVIGTAEALTSTEAAHIIWDSAMEAQGDATEREGAGLSMSEFSPVAGAIFNKTTFKHELYGNTSAALPGFADAMKACGMAVTSLVLSPQSGSATANTVTLGVYRDGWLNTSAGCMGNFTIKGESGKPAIVEYEFSGSYIAPSNVAVVAPTFPSTAVVPVFMSSTFTIGGSTYPISSFELSPNNTVGMIEDGTQPFGYRGAVITKRAWSVKVSPELQLAKNWWTTFSANTTGALSIVLNGGTNATWTIAAPAMYLVKAPQTSEKNGYYTVDLEFRPTRSASAGDDEVTLTLS